MYAVIESGGKQYRVELGSEIQVDRLDVQPGDPITFDRVLLVADGEEAAIGRPFVDGAVVNADVVSQVRGDKVVVFKYRPKARRRVKKGFRASLTTLRISDIGFGGSSAAKEAAKDEKQRQQAERKAEKAAADQAAADQELASRLAAQVAAQEAATEESAAPKRKRSSRSAAAKAAAAAEPTQALDEPEVTAEAQSADEPEVTAEAQSATDPVEESAAAEAPSATDESATADRAPETDADTDTTPSDKDG